MKSFEKNVTIEVEEEFTQEYIIGPGGKLSLYQLCYSQPATIVKTNIVATIPKPDLIVQLKFACETSLVGLQPIINVLSNTRPRCDNIEEWNCIRDCIVKHAQEKDENQFQNLIKILSTITPNRDNKSRMGAHPADLS